MWLSRTTPSTKPWNLTAAGSQPPKSLRVQVSWMSLPSTTEKAQPRLPTTPVCSQWCMWFLRTMWPPTVALSQPLARARFTQAVYGSAAPASFVLSVLSPYLPRETPQHLEYAISLSSMIQPLLQFVPTTPVCSEEGAAQFVAAL